MAGLSAKFSPETSGNTIAKSLILLTRKRPGNAVNTIRNPLKSLNPNTETKTPLTGGVSANTPDGIKPTRRLPDALPSR